jgi:cellulose synthase/poly-beta-1,6-N-acetylglucosamine synthase-like glycosyltransferase
MEVPIAQVIFWSCALALLYTYLGYPLALSLRSPRPIRPEPDGSWPAVSVLVAAFNEAGCIADKVRNTLAQDYQGRLECVVVSDGSTDCTAEAAADVADSRLTVIALPRNQGKCLALNRAVEAATGAVLVFTDANAMLEPGALGRLCRPFADDGVGLVSGKGVLVRPDGDGVHVIGSTYLEYEDFLRDREQRFGYIAWADGALYALRRSLFRPLSPVHANDFLHPIQVALQGYRAAFERSAVFREPAGGSSQGEFRRQARMIGQGIWILATEGRALIRHRRWTVLWQLASHRVLRWMGPLFLAGALAASAVLARDSALYQVLLAGQLAFYLVAALGAVSEWRGWRTRFLSVPYYFCLVNLAGLVGLARVVAGNVQATWTPVRPA